MWDSLPSAETSRDAPSAWVTRFAALIRPDGCVLDFACGRGWHARWLAAKGFRVEAVDRDLAALSTLRQVPGIAIRQADLENGGWPYDGRVFDAVIVTRYLYRPRMRKLLALVAENGILIYETYMRGQQKYGRPRNPDFLLEPGELPDWLDAHWRIVAFEQDEAGNPQSGCLQRICAIRKAAAPD